MYMQCTSAIYSADSPAWGVLTGLYPNFIVYYCSPGYVNEATNSTLTLNLSLAHDLAEYPHQVIRNKH